MRRGYLLQEEIVMIISRKNSDLLSPFRCHQLDFGSIAFETVDTPESGVSCTHICY